MAKSLGQELSTSLSHIRSLIMKTKSKSERMKLTQQHAQIAGQLQVFVDKVVDAALPEYEAATQALNAANGEAQAATEKLDKVAGTIEQFGVAIDKLAALAAKVGAA